MSVATVLNRAALGFGDPAPVRIVHLGLGAFHRSHQAWYTHAVDTDHSWGIAAFTGRSPDAARVLAAQDGLYTLVTRSDDGDEYEVVQSISAAHDGADLGRLCSLMASAATAIITITVTEAAYHLSAGRLNLEADPVAADVSLLARRWQTQGDLALPENAGGQPLPTTMGARVLTGLDARRRAGAGPLAVVSCDNLSANGDAASQAIHGLALEVSDELADWVKTNVSFVNTSIDRITPRTTDSDVAAIAAATGIADSSPVITEPFHNWVLSGRFPAGRPPWEEAGALFVDDIEHFERRKLWLLNGAHSLLAYASQLLGHATVADSLADTRCAEWINSFWDEASTHLTEPDLGVPEYRTALLRRFGNSRIAHQLSQIAVDGSSKLRLRILPVLSAERAAGRNGQGSARAVAAWIDHLDAGRAAGAPPADAEADALQKLLHLDGRNLTEALIGHLDGELGKDAALIDLVHTLRRAR
ncbi:mannitol dehydrogenase family protein [Arthrobacter sp. H41]|uniref:mannitol dehydrogenase family protein n=1 Tax=Arthrobacter sp. H41 TaxID=1312978 RepID=UPI000676AC39|nr:mannitol dehydrogenase family protein [Arthrobacter sp. H41]